MQCTVHWAAKGAATTVVSSKAVAWDMEEEARRERRRRTRQRLVGYCKATAAFLFSHIGLAGLVVAYSIIGGFLFQTLEAPYERTEKKRLMKWKNKTIDDIWQLAVALHDDGDNFSVAIRDVLNTFQTGVIAAMKDVGWDGKDLSDDNDLRWSYAGALLYAVTVITTIGESRVCLLFHI
ncbi:hypothetical protein NP493_1232g00003 [Ridgeia piscesae]|uniref:Uncharacterized protein n=1 Tax=Ridgeia piscesae TaxID=27915 RepID=A0AAD9KBX2_RIDPI|nr:hypothetical protein NP493_1232g00003 [Ridgeia piscesae]